MQDTDGTGTTPGKEDKQMELQLGGRHLTLAVVGLALFGVVLFLLGRWSERVARPQDAAGEGIEETSLSDSRGAPDPAAPRELTFYETLGKKGTPGFQESSLPAGRKEPPAQLPESSPLPPGPPAKSAAPPASKSAPSSAAKGAAAPAPKAKGASAAPSAGNPGEHFRVQVASTRDAAAARALAERLRKKGYAASVETSRGADGRSQYKVRVGNYSERGPAEDVAARIRSEEKVGAWIVKVQG